MPVNEVDGKASEIAFVQRFWTDRLAANVGHTVEDDLPHRDEYRIMKPHLDALPQGARILDEGCGAGEWTVFLARRGYDVCGLDISESLISRLRELFPQLTFVRGDLRQTNMDDGRFDAIFSWGAFEHFEAGLGPCLQEACRLLKPGGLLFFSVPYANARQLRLRPGRCGSGVTEGVRFYQWRFTRDDIASALEKDGWGIAEITPIHKEHGVARMLLADYHVDLSWLGRLQRPCLRALGMFVTADYVSHMLMAVARRPVARHAEPDASPSREADR